MLGNTTTYHSEQNEESESIQPMFSDSSLFSDQYIIFFLIFVTTKQIDKKYGKQSTRSESS